MQSDAVEIVPAQAADPAIIESLASSAVGARGFPVKFAF
jgi:hypothetical protein